jgi:hypothetical protein
VAEQFLDANSTGLDGGINGPAAAPRDATPQIETLLNWVLAPRFLELASRALPCLALPCLALPLGGLRTI